MIVSFLRFGRAKYIEDSYNNNYLYFNCLSKFRSSVNDFNARFDPREGNVYQEQIGYLELTINNKINKLHEILKDFNSQFQLYQKRIPGNICSLYSIKMEDYESEKTIYIDERMYYPYGKVLLFYNLSEFLNDLDRSIINEGYGCTRKEVRYYNRRTYEGDLTFHHKDSEFAFQNEYRILLKSDGTKPIKIPLPNMKDYTKIISNKEATRIEIKLKLK